MSKKTIAIVVALKNETQSLLEKLNFKPYATYSSKEVFKTKFKKRNLFLIISGIGKVNASFSTQILIDKFAPQAIINFGTCGGLYPNVKIRNFYRVNECLQYDFDLSKLDNVKVGYIQDYNTDTFTANVNYNSELEIKKLATSDRFTCTDEDLNTVKENNCDIFDMEGCAIAETCLANSIPLYIIKGVSDISGEESQRGQYYENSLYLRQNFPKHIIDLLEKI